MSGLSNQVPYYDHALDLILDEESSSHGEIITEEQNELIESAAEVLYGMIHSRYLLTYLGLCSMLNVSLEDAQELIVVANIVYLFVYPISLEQVP
ncbi:unnamed protein product [Arabis nemorensis]|uniref:Casein kinase II subunit beta n=1 Tax=Arabis nemorensis TaxID=586526 RepID=A0A565C7A1_9BRAS|nr:unnamed protein product [Arabis nemorensis]